MNEIFSKIYDRTDSGNAHIFADLFRNSFKYECKSRTWMAWDGRRWNREIGEIKAQQACRDIARYWHFKLQHSPLESEQKEIFKHWQYTSSAVGIRNALFVARSESGITISAEELDIQPMLLNVLDGTIDLRTGILREHRESDLITQLANVSYCPEIEEPCMDMWKDCVLTWHPDGKVDGTWEYLEKLMGYCCTGDTSSRCFPIFWGSGKNGKNVFLDTFLLMLGDYASVAPRTLIEASGRDEHPTELADLWGKRLILASEPKKGSKLKTSLVKAMTGDSIIKARFMRKDFFDFKPTHKVIMMTQNLPQIDETSDAIWDRIHRLRWGVRIPREKQNPHLVEDLKAEWPGILRWTIRGCLKWQKPPGILLPTEKIENEVRQYRDEQNPAKKFVDANYVIGGANMCVPTGMIQQKREEWNSYADNEVGNSDLTAYLTEAGCRRSTRHVNGTPTKVWVGLGAR